MVKLTAARMAVIGAIEDAARRGETQLALVKATAALQAEWERIEQLNRVLAAAQSVIAHMTTRHGVPEWKEAQRDRANPNPARWSPLSVQMDTAPLMALREAVGALPHVTD